MSEKRPSSVFLKQPTETSNQTLKEKKFIFVEFMWAAPRTVKSLLFIVSMLPRVSFQVDFI